MFFYCLNLNTLSKRIRKQSHCCNVFIKCPNLFGTGLIKLSSSTKAWTWSCRAPFKGLRKLGVHPGTRGSLASVSPSPLFSELGRSIPQSLAGLAAGFRVRRDILPLAPFPRPSALPRSLKLSSREQKVTQLETK